MMNDFGLCQAINAQLQSDNFLRSTLTGFFSQVPATVQFPYAVIKVQEVWSDCFRPPQKISMNLMITLLSRYAGFKEIHKLMSRVGELIEPQPLLLKVQETSFVAKAVLRLKQQEIKRQKDGITRAGVMSYQARLRQV